MSIYKFSAHVCHMHIEFEAPLWLFSVKGGFRRSVRGAEAPPSRFIAPLSKFLLAERGTSKSRSSVSFRLTVTVEEGGLSSCKKVR